VTTQSPHLYARQHGPAARGREHAGDPAGTARRAGGAGAQTRLPWWAVALPALAFAVLLALLTSGSADASAATSSGDWLGRVVTALPEIIHRLL
jgi:hypothetical protein